jgi:ABC-type multidrug transport system fused ATPase/permease subunit
MVLWSLIGVLFTGLILFLIGIFLLALYIGVFVLLPGYVIYACAKLIMWLIEKGKGKVERNDRVKSKLNLSFLEQKYKQMMNEEIQPEKFNKYLQNEIHIHYNDNYNQCQKVFEDKMNAINQGTEKSGLSIWHILAAVLVTLLLMNWFGMHLTLLLVAIGIFIFYALYAFSANSRESNSCIRYSMYKHIVQYCIEKTTPIVVEDSIVQMTIDDIMPEDNQAEQKIVDNNIPAQEIEHETSLNDKETTQSDVPEMEEKEQ